MTNGGCDTLGKRPTTAFIDRNALRHNYIQLKNHISEDVKILAVVKADAYGHGAIEVSRILGEVGCRYFGVAILEEAALLRDAGINSDIIILGGVYEGQESDVIKYRLTPVVFDEKTLASLDHAAGEKGQKISIHVKVDTGMGRLGLQTHEVIPFFNKLKGFKNIAVEGILTHLAEIYEDNKNPPPF